MNQTDTQEEKKEILYKEDIAYWDETIRNFVKEIGAKNHSIDMNMSIIATIPVITKVTIEIFFQNGRSYGQSDESFKECFNKLVRFVSSKEL